MNRVTVDKLPWLTASTSRQLKSPRRQHYATLTAGCCQILAQLPRCYSAKQRDPSALTTTTDSRPCLEWSPPTVSHQRGGKCWESDVQRPPRLDWHTWRQLVSTMYAGGSTGQCHVVDTSLALLTHQPINVIIIIIIQIQQSSVSVMFHLCMSAVCSYDCKPGTTLLHTCEWAHVKLTASKVNIIKVQYPAVALLDISQPVCIVPTNHHTRLRFS